MKTHVLRPTDKNIRVLADCINGGGVVAFHTETVYGLGADVFNESAVNEIFRVKGRPADNPLIVHVCDGAQIAEVAESIPPLAQKLIDEFMPGPLTLILRKKQGIPDCVTAGLPTVGVRMPSSQPCRAFLKACTHPVCAPSANTSTKPSPTCARHVYDDLQGKIPFILDGGNCEVGLESTILDVSDEKPRLLRAGGISKESLEKFCGMSIETVRSSTVALCPGMKYKHYAPKADVYFSSYYRDMSHGICDCYDRLVSSGKKVVVLCLQKNIPAYGERDVYDMGKSYNSYARRLFAYLRKADDCGYDAIIAEGVPSKGIGLALINRLVKSSGGRII